MCNDLHNYTTKLLVVPLENIKSIYTYAHTHTNTHVVYVYYDVSLVP